MPEWLRVAAGFAAGLGQELLSDLHLFLGLLGFLLHPLHLHLLLLDPFLFLGDEVVNVHTTLDTKAEVGFEYSREMTVFRSPHHTRQAGGPQPHLLLQ